MMDKCEFTCTRGACADGGGITDCADGDQYCEYYTGEGYCEEGDQVIKCTDDTDQFTFLFYLRRSRQVLEL